MRHYKILDGGYIVFVGVGMGGTEISEAEYNPILAVIAARPADTPTRLHRLRTDLGWDEIAVEPPAPDPDPELDGDEALAILLGDAV